MFSRRKLLLEGNPNPRLKVRLKNVKNHFLQVLVSMSVLDLELLLLPEYSRKNFANNQSKTRKTVS